MRSFNKNHENMPLNHVKKKLAKNNIVSVRKMLPTNAFQTGSQR